jgi:hypothetical protein
MAVGINSVIANTFCTTIIALVIATPIMMMIVKIATNLLSTGFLYAQSKSSVQPSIKDPPIPIAKKYWLLNSLNPQKRDASGGKTINRKTKKSTIAPTKNVNLRIFTPENTYSQPGARYFSFNYSDFSA